MSEESKKQVVVIGGPNGAGKTSWALQNLAQTTTIAEFVNADEIARGLFPLDPEGSAVAAGQLMIDRLEALVASEKSFAFETTCAGWRHIGF